MTKRVSRKIGLTKGWRIAGIIAAVLTAAAAVCFTVVMANLGVLPKKYMIVILVVIWIVTVLVCEIQFFRRMKIPSKILAAILIVILIIGSCVSSRLIKVMNTASNVTTSVDTVQVYVLNDDPAETINDAEDYQFGILASLDRENTDEARESIEETLETELSVTEYESMIDLANALLDGEIGAILVNSAYINTVDEDDSLSDFPDDIRVLTSYDIERELEIAGDDDDEEDDDILSPFIVYISGNDASGSLKATGRSDVNILMAVNPKTHTVLLVNTPRDYYVELAGIGAYDKLTHAGIYGVDVSMNTLGNLYDVSVKYYVRMNFTGFVEIVDALGGIMVESEYAFTVGEYEFGEGTNYLDGEAALAFARERYSFSSGDRQRGKNQMAVITAVIKKLTSTALLTGYSDIMDAAADSMETNLTQAQIAELVQYQLEYGGSWTVETISADGTGGMTSVYSMPSSNLYVMYPDEDIVAEIKEKLKEVLSEEE